MHDQPTQPPPTTLRTPASSRFDFTVRATGFEDAVQRAHAAAEAFWGDEDYRITHFEAIIGYQRMDAIVIDYVVEVTTVLGS